ncbi:MAG: hypothetical protein LQ346_001749 [Caloplaca aetnensis]|nr:MAG: hypothetical protein LQ346_001749 [Caloplaca aetnensis]
MQRYDYSEVDSTRREIRLLTLHSRETSDEIRVTLKNVTLDPNSPPSYEALSYTWGSAQDKVPIRIKTAQTAETIRSAISGPTNHSTNEFASSTQQLDRQYNFLEVTQNLAVALEHLQYDQEPRVLWVDAICINQQDVEERSAQVQLMADIYWYANQTTVWLGPEDDDSSLALETLDDLGSRITFDWTTYTCRPAGGSEDDDTLANVNKDLPWDQKQWASIILLLQRPWFERLWIWQEVRLAEKDVRTVFQDFVLSAIEETQILEPLLLCDLQKPLPHAPSWVPNIPDSMPNRDLYFLEADGNTRARAVYQGNGILEVSGILLTSISDIVYINDRVATRASDWYHILCSELRRLFPLIWRNLDSDLYPGGGSLVEVFCRTIYCNHFDDDDVLTHPSPRLFQNCFDQLSKILKASEDDFTESHPEIVFLRKYLASRNFFTTSQGYIGLAPTAAKSGDHVSILLGCPAPIVFRPTDDGSFIVVGQCYIHGFGNGEALFGPFPSAWERTRRDGCRKFFSRATGTWSLTDPRLGKLPDGWELISNHDDDRSAVFEEISTGEITSVDPRQSPEAILARGVDLRTITLK